MLVSIEDVTARVNAAVKPGASLAEAEKARRAAMNTIEQESLEKTGLRSDVITLYRGGLYHLYRYKKYTDVRLVFAPEESGRLLRGDPDNFEYPRYDLDICFFRVYENGRPAKIEHYLKWRPAGPATANWSSSPGHPGQDRPAGHAGPPGVPPRPVAARDARPDLPPRGALATYSERSAENARRAQKDLFNMQNSRKARSAGWPACRTRR